MNKLKSNQDGIAHLLIVLIIALLAILGFTVYRMMQSNNKSDSKASTSDTKTTDVKTNAAETESKKESAKFLTIKEWGIKFALTTATADAYYDTKTGSPIDSMSLRSHSLDSETDCTNTAQSVASIFRVPKDEVNEQTSKKYSEGGDGQTIGEYYYFIQSSQYLCTDDKEKAIILQGVRNSFNTAGPTIVKS